VSRPKKRRPLRLGEQLPEPEWARDLADGKPEKAQELLKSIEEMEEHFGEGAGDAVRDIARSIMGRALLRKVERDNPEWDGQTRVQDPHQTMLAQPRKDKDAERPNPTE